ncbi:MAG TPA: hypothetical protein DCL44_06195 [Elusimicrobia bacterium]|nr:hypothetical protein [Elusimicrobiota bacterium]
MSLALLSGCAGNIKDNIFMGIGAYSILWRAKETRKRHKEAMESYSHREQGAGADSRAGLTAASERPAEPGAMIAGSSGISPAEIEKKNVFLQAFQAGREDFKRFRYQNCKTRMLTAVVDADSTELKAQALFYAGACAFYLGRREEAEKYFAQARSLFPAFVPNENVFTPALIKVYKKCGK